MKKTFKNMLSLVLALTMVLAMGMTAMAATYSKQTPSSEDVVTGHTYKAYQIFTASSIDDEGNLGGLDWATGITDATKTALLGGKADIKALVESLGSDDSDNALAFAKTAYTNKSGLANATAVTNGTTVLGLGYWIIVDETTASVKVVNTANLYVSDGETAVSIISKVDAPSSDKKIKDINDTTGEQTGWQDSADYDIGDKIPFKLTATLPSNYTSYTTYHLTFHDKEGAGLAFDPSTVKVYVGNSTTPVAVGNYTVVSSPADRDTFDVVFTFANLTAMNVTNSSVIRVEYESELTDDAVYGQPGNPNTSYITYDNNPNSDQDGEEGGKTPEDTVIAFTYKTVVNKVDQDEQALTGADFTLYKEVPEGTTDAVTGADIKATFTDNNVKAAATALEDSKYYITVSKKEGTTAVSVFTFKGIDDGTYVLVETTVPTGYNAWTSKKVVVEATHTADVGEENIDAATGKNASTGAFILTELKDSGNTFTTVNLTDGTLSADIKNQKGNTLPSTGGIGTTLFYVFGAVLVLGAGVVLVSRRRMEA